MNGDQESFESLSSTMDAVEIATADNLQRWPAGQHILALIYNGKLEDARMLYKRLPRAVQSHQDVVAAFQLLQILWQKDYENMYGALTNHNWAAESMPLVLALQDKLRSKMLRLLSRSYSSIRVQKAATLLGVDPAEVLRVAESEGWELDAASEVFKVHRKPKVAAEWVQPEQIQRLTEFVVHLES